MAPAALPFLARMDKHTRQVSRQNHHHHCSNHSNHSNHSHHSHHSHHSNHCNHRNRNRNISSLSATATLGLVVYASARMVVAMLDASVGAATPAAMLDVFLDAATLEMMGAANFGSIDRVLAPVGLGLVNAEEGTNGSQFSVGTLSETDFFFAEFESGTGLVCGLAGWSMIATASLGAALLVLCQAVFQKPNV